MHKEKKGEKKMTAKQNEKEMCGKDTEVYSRIVGYFRPVANWNKGKRQEFTDRKTYGVLTGK